MEHGLYTRGVRAASHAILVSMCLFGTPAMAHDGPYYVVDETFALSVGEGRKHIIAFLPRRFLLFIEDRESTQEVSGNVYLRALTQDGVEVLVLESAVSRKRFSESIGSHEIIFNSAFDDLVCKRPACQGAEVDRYWNIARGDAFKKVEGPSASGLLKIEGSDDVVGYVDPAMLRSMVMKGFVTEADRKHPRYKVKKTPVEILTTECGSEIPDYLDTGHDREAVERVLELVSPRFADFDDASPGRLVITTEYGGEGKKVEFRIYEIEDHWDEAEPKNFSVVAMTTYECQLGALNREGLNYIEQVTLWSERYRGESFELGIHDKEFRTPKDWARYTGDAPYLVSINSYDQFEAVISVLSEKLGDRELAGYALSEINRSCAYTYRKNKTCTKHIYGESD